MEKIISIENTDWKENKEDYREYSGYVITTDKQQIKVGISNQQSCCENWGYVTSEDDLTEYVGCSLIGITTTDSMLENKPFTGLDTDSGNCMFITFKTDKGDFQFVAYNEHNGYYSHEVTLISEQLKESEYL